MTTQTAVALTAIGKPLEKISLPIPIPKEGQVLLKVVASGCNPMDFLIQEHGVLGFENRLPAILAFDVVGTIHSYGPNASKTLPIGTQVFSQVATSDAQGGGLQQYTTVLERFCIPVPKNTTPVEASTFPINGFTAATALFSDKGLNIPLPGTEASKGFEYGKQTVVVIGGGTNTGKFGIQFLRNVGIGKIVVTASLAREEELKGYGATHVIDRKASDVKDQIRAIVGDDLVYVYNTFRTPDHNLQISILSDSKKGKLVSIIPGEFKVRESVRSEKKAGWEYSVTFGLPTGWPELAGLFWKIFVGWVEEGKITPSKVHVVEGLDVDRINEELEGMKAWAGDGKLTVRM